MIFNKNDKNVLKLVFSVVIIEVGITIKEVSPIIGGIVFFLGALYALKKFVEVFK